MFKRSEAKRFRTAKNVESTWSAKTMQPVKWQRIKRIPMRSVSKLLWRSSSCESTVSVHAVECDSSWFYTNLFQRYMWFGTRSRFLVSIVLTIHWQWTSVRVFIFKPNSELAMTNNGNIWFYSNFGLIILSRSFHGKNKQKCHW